MTKKNDKETTITGRTPRPPANQYPPAVPVACASFVANPTFIAADYRQLEEREAAQLLERFKEVFPEIAAYMHRNTVRPPTHALKPEATHENPVVLCEDPEARYTTPWPTPPLASNGPVTCIACLHIITRDRK